MHSQSWFGVHRSLKEQMQGLDELLRRVQGKTILDVGSAEGLIAIECLKVGAASAQCLERDECYVRDGARHLRKWPAQMIACDLNLEVPRVRRADVMLLLAILHKLQQPLVVLEDLIGQAHPQLAVVRYAVHQDDGVILDARSNNVPQNVPAKLHELGYRETLRAPGPREEATVYYERG